jgi:hypothetical protein
VPTDDKTAAQTLHRMKELSAVWEALPNVPETTKAFAVQGVTEAVFDQQIEELDAKISEYSKESALLDNQEAKLRVLNARVEDFITAALVQGRAQFAPGTPERALIEAVPTEPSTQRPGQAQFSLSVVRRRGRCGWSSTRIGRRVFRCGTRGRARRNSRRWAIRSGRALTQLLGWRRVNTITRSWA